MKPERYTPIWNASGFVMSPQSSGEYVRIDDPAIVAALAIAHAAREAGLVDEEGKLRKIVGTVPVTADGVIVGGDVMQLWSRDGRKITLGRWCGPLSCTPEEIERDGECVSCPHWVGVMHLYFSNPSAAERAAKGGGDA